MIYARIYQFAMVAKPDGHAYTFLPLTEERALATTHEVVDTLWTAVEEWVPRNFRMELVHCWQAELGLFDRLVWESTR